MGRHVLLALMLLSLIVFDSSDASFVWKLRKLVALDPNDNKTPTTQDNIGQNQEEEKKKNGLIFSQSITNETCDGLNRCTDDGDMLACISKFDPKYLVVLLQNRGDGTIKVKLRNEFGSNLGDVEVGKNNTEKVNITQTSSESTQLTLNAGKGDCVLHTVTRVPEANFFSASSFF